MQHFDAYFNPQEAAIFEIRVTEWVTDWLTDKLSNETLSLSMLRVHNKLFTKRKISLLYQKEVTSGVVHHYYNDLWKFVTYQFIWRHANMKPDWYKMVCGSFTKYLIRCNNSLSVNRLGQWLLTSIIKYYSMWIVKSISNNIEVSCCQTVDLFRLSKLIILWNSLYSDCL